MPHFLGVDHKRLQQEAEERNQAPTAKPSFFVQKVQARMSGAGNIKIPRLLSDILSETAGTLVSASDSNLQLRQRRRLGKRALRTLQIGQRPSAAPIVGAA